EQFHQRFTHDADVGSAAAACHTFITGFGRFRSRTIVRFRLVAGRRIPARSRADGGPGLAHRGRLPGNRSDASNQEDRPRSAGGAALPAGRRQCGRGAGHETSGPRRRHSRGFEQGTHADAPAHAPGADAGPACEVEQTIRAVGQGSQPRTWGQVTERHAMIRIRSIGIVAAFVLAATAAQAQTPQLSAARIHELIQQAAAQAVAQPQTGTQPPAGNTPDNRPRVPMTLDEAVKLALDRNLDIAVQQLSPAIQDVSVARIKSVYYPALTSQLATQSTTTPANSTLAGSTQPGAPVTAGLSTYNVGVAQSVPWF